MNKLKIALAITLLCILILATTELTLSTLTVKEPTPNYTTQSTAGEYIPVNADQTYTILNLNGSGCLDEISSLAWAGGCSLTDTKITFIIDGETTVTDSQTLFCVSGINDNGLIRNFKTDRLCGVSNFDSGHFGGYLQYPFYFTENLQIKVTPISNGGLLFYQFMYHMIPHSSLSTKIFSNGGWENRVTLNSLQYTSLINYQGSGQVLGLWSVMTSPQYACEGNLHWTLDSNTIETIATEDAFLDWWGFQYGSYEFNLAVHTDQGRGLWGNYANLLDRGAPYTFEDSLQFSWQNEAHTNIELSYFIPVTIYT
jgi:hypothetical protein